MDSKSSGLFANLKYDFPAGLVVFLVAVPLCLGIALASGAPLFSGIIAGMVGGIVVTIFSGSPLGVSGPAAGLAAIVVLAIPTLGFESFLLAVFIAGALQFGLGVLKAGIIGYFFPTSVIKGMLAGIGVIIFLKELPHAFGYDGDPIGDVFFQQADGHNTFTAIYDMMDYVTPGAVVISLISLAILILWERPFIKKLAISQWIQGPLLAVITGIVMVKLFADSSTYNVSQEHLVNMPVAEGIAGFVDLFTTPDFSQWNNPKVYVTAATIAAVASIETLLCVEATDKLDPFKRVTPTNKELRAQGIGNMVSGLIGGLPVTQVIVRSSANIQSGGRTRLSSFIHGMLILLCVISIPTILNMIPLASLAAILLVVGYKLAKPALFKSMYAKGWMEFIPFVVTIVGIVFTDLLTGIGYGMVVAIFFILFKNYNRPFYFNAEEDAEGHTITLRLSENVSFLNKAAISRSLEKLPDDHHIIIDGSKTVDIHPDIIEIIHDFEAHAHQRGITVELLEVKEVEEAKDVSNLFRTIADREDLKENTVIDSNK